MKKLLMAVTFVGFLSAANAQNPHVQFGLKAGVNVSNQVSKGFDYNPKAGFHTGGLAHIHLSEHWAIQPELMFSTQGARYQNNGSDVIRKMDYLLHPVLVQYMTRSGFRLETGPQLGVLLKARQQVDEGVNTNIRDNYNGAEFSWVVGAGFVFPSGFGFDARYNAGISRINENGSNALRNGVFQFGVFYQFPPLRHR